ncbi:hypothetical protein [Rhizobium halophytocola]|uniref:O-linked N-acetylglucosamine transferase (SPINDLY family) n=1 Tax=Rhizobium halophytocola TaxID=735519 RepID=A0ABS4E1V8_9HYPH|nr:hypothetical protein [Rhizobium halophytocola]MBP1851920.1 putative O-linked N-acetylglucosamine transferase (SPINDLY family) [Rhizobium halophytocola]
MASALQTALKHYQSGQFAKALDLIRPLALEKNRPGIEVLLIAGQSCAKLQLSAEAADYFTQAADLKTAKEPMFRALAAEFRARADDSQTALTLARTAAKTLPFDAHTFRTFRSLLQETFTVDERRLEDQALLDRLKRGDSQYLAGEQHLDNISWCADESVNKSITYGLGSFGSLDKSRAARRSRPHRFQDKIRVGYLSNDFCDQHPTMHLFQGVLMSHDPERFDITLFCHTDKSVVAEDLGMRKRYPTIVPIGHLDDDKAAKLIRSHQIDILVDLKGATRGARMGLVNKGLAPIQVAYLGFPGSGVGIDCDYVVGDRFVLPDSSKPHYHEKFCRMPDSYQANDNLFRATPAVRSRSEIGLPEGRLVFSSFNASRKITWHTLDLWTQVLSAVKDSVLWLMLKTPLARQNLVAWMEREGIAAERLIFTSYVTSADHVARLGAADIALDSFPYNGHTTTSDALWAGVPVPTYYGSHFASRVSASLLHAVDLPELVADDPAGYVALTVRLAQNRLWREGIRQHLRDRRQHLPLFDTARFTRHLETGYAMMVERARAGLPADHITIPAMDTTGADSGAGAAPALPQGFLPRQRMAG